MHIVNVIAKRLAVRRARSSARAGDRSGVADALRTAARLDPTNARAQFDAARAAQRAAQWDAAAEAYRAAIALDGARAGWRFRLGRTLERSGRWDEAADAYRAAIALDGGRARWHFRLGRTLERLRRWDEAVDAYRAAIALDGGRARWHFRLGRTLERSGRWDEAADAYRAAIVLDDAVPEWPERLAGVLHRAGDTEGARRMTAAIAERQGALTPVERRLLDGDPERFTVRRQLLAFVAAHMDEINEQAAAMRTASGTVRQLWVYWGQGMSDAPPVVRRCYAEVQRHHAAERVTVLDDRRVEQYVDLPGYVRDRTRDDRTKFSDVLRLDLLARHGGVWLDATCLPRCDVLAMLPELLRSGFFAPRHREARMSSWLLASEPGHRVIAALRAAQVIYWREHDRAIDYYVLHHLFEALLLLDPAVGRCFEEAPWVRSQTLARLRRALFEPYEPERFRELLDAAFVHKLTYKIPPDRDQDGTVLAHLLHSGTPETSVATVTIA